METFDVAIVGYGPVGQLLSILLAGQGHRTVVLERFPAPYPLPRAVHLDHEVARILQTVDLRSDRDQVIEPYDNWYEWRNAERKTLLKVDWRGVGPSWWHTSNFFSQPELERELDARSRAQPLVELRRGWTVTDVRQDADGVTLTAAVSSAAGAGDTQEVRARYVVGCDGANSAVRRQVGLTVTDLGFFFDWLILDMIPNEPMTFDPPAWQLCDPARPTTIVPGGPGRRRWEFMALPGEDVQDLNKEERAWALLQPWGVTPGNATMERHTVYRFQARWAHEWRKDRVLIAGDAAHQMPPFAGQGMCAGLRDAFNLAWKLGLVLDGVASDAMLSSYGPERTPHVRHFIDMSMELGRVICVPDAEAALKRDRDMIAALENDSLAPPAASPPRLGPGLFAAGDPSAGLLSIQSQVVYQGQSGLFDDVVGRGWFVLCRGAAPTLSPAAAGVGERLGIRVLSIGGAGVSGVDVVDSDGRYGQWFDELSAEVVVVRPDFYIYAALGAASGLDAALESLGRAVEAPALAHA